MIFVIGSDSDDWEGSESAYQAVGLDMGPLSSERVFGNWLALRGPWRNGLYHEAALYNSKLLLRLGSKTPTCFSQLGASHPDRELEIRVVGDHDGHFVVIIEAVQQQIGCEVDVGALLLDVEDFNRTWAARRLVGKRPPLGLRQEVSVVHGDARCRLQGADVGLLALGLGWVSGAAVYEGGEIAYAAYVVPWKQEPCQLPDVQPSVRSAPQGAIPASREYVNPEGESEL